jgi:hypothetical protein
MAERDIIDELFEVGGGKIAASSEGPTEFVTRGELRLESARTISVLPGWVIYKGRVWISANAQFASRCEADIKAPLCELLPRHPEIDTVLISGCINIAPGDLSFILSPTIRHVICPSLGMIPLEAHLETLRVEEHSCVPGRAAAVGCCRCQTLAILYLDARRGVAGLLADVEEWGKERGARELVVEKIRALSNSDREEARRIIDTFTPYEEDEDEILGPKPAATRVPYDD